MAAETKTSLNNTVFVFANLPHGQSFALPDGREIILAGYPISQLVGPDGNVLPGGQYGVTEVRAGDWKEIKKLYGSMVVMRSGAIFDAPSREEGQVMAEERAEVRHGLEPVDPETTATKPDKKDKG